MIAIFDVGYAENGNQAANAVSACVTLSNWMDAKPAGEFSIRIDHVQPYVPGEFYRRELPCILQTLEHLPESPRVIIVDGYVWLSPEGKKGLGAHLFEALGKTVPVVGVAKSHFRLATNATKILRGASKHPLYVTAEGISQAQVAEQVRLMHGKNRIPTALKRVDQLSRMDV